MAKLVIDLITFWAISMHIYFDFSMTCIKLISFKPVNTSLGPFIAVTPSSYSHTPLFNGLIINIPMHHFIINPSFIEHFEKFPPLLILPPTIYHRRVVFKLSLEGAYLLRIEIGSCFRGECHLTHIDYWHLVIIGNSVCINFYVGSGLLYMSISLMLITLIRSVSIQFWCSGFQNLSHNIN